MEELTAPRHNRTAFSRNYWREAVVAIMSRTFWQGFLLGALAFGALGVWASPRRRNPWEQRRRAVAQSARRIMTVSRGATKRLAQQIRR